MYLINVSSAQANEKAIIMLRSVERRNQPHKLRRLLG